MLGKNKKQDFRIIAVLEELSDISGMLKDYLEEYGYKCNIASRLEINIQEDFVILQLDPNNIGDLKRYRLEALVINLKNPLVYKKDILKLSKHIDKTGSVIGDKFVIDKLEKNISKNLLLSKVDYSEVEENKPIHSHKYIGFYAETLTRSLYKYTDNIKETDKAWKINNKYAYKLEALLFATINSCGLIN